jgi:hypothetical protein
MRKHAILILLITSVTLANAQPGKIAGLVVAGDGRISSAIIKNINNHQQILSDERGAFEISSKPGDSLIISKTDYITDTLLIQDQQPLIVRLKKPATMLKEVDINSTVISPAAVHAANKKEYKQIYFLGDNTHIFSIPTIIGPVVGLNVNIDKLNNALGKKGRDARKLQRALTTDYKNSTVDHRFNPLAARITGYKDKQLSDFIRDNRPSYEMVSRASDYDIIQYIKKKVSGKKT